MHVTASHVQEQLGSFRQALELVVSPSMSVGDGVDSTADIGLKLHPHLLWSMYI